MGRYFQIFDAASSWQRPLPERWMRIDAAWALAILAAAALCLELARSMGSPALTGSSLWAQYLTVISAAVLLIWRRRFPISVGLIASIHLFAASTAIPGIAAQITMQVLYFVAIYSAVAWARDRQSLGAAAGFVLVLMLAWGSWYFAFGQGVSQLAETADNASLLTPGLLDPVVAGVLLVFLINIAYFAGATALGVANWRSARAQAIATTQADTIVTQAEELRERAVMDERLRIARELHDVVAHHVAAIGVQAGAARTVLPQHPDSELTAGALRAVEESSRSAVHEMRALLGTLRDVESARLRTPGSEPDSAAAAGRHPDPTVVEIPTLVNSSRSSGFGAEFTSSIDPAVPLEVIPPTVGVSLYRTVQEALVNVRRHSTAVEARVTLRTGDERGRTFAEVEILDDGRPRVGSSGSGLGLLGMRERVSSHRGSCEIGPRATGGYRVRVRLPLGESR